MNSYSGPDGGEYYEPYNQNTNYTNNEQHNQHENYVHGGPGGQVYDEISYDQHTYSSQAPGSNNQGGADDDYNTNIYGELGGKGYGPVDQPYQSGGSYHMGYNLNSSANPNESRQFIGSNRSDIQSAWNSTQIHSQTNSYGPPTAVNSSTFTGNHQNHLGGAGYGEDMQ